MNPQLADIRDRQKESWNKFSGGWKKWDAMTMDFLQPMGDEMIRLLKPKNRNQILDIAAGTGEPGLTIATMLNGGIVTITDLSEQMLQITREKATARNITNIETVACDVCELPFADNSFDAISCRFGFMFFPDMQLAAQEMFRVLKHGGKIATAVWNIPEKNFWVTAIMGTINQLMQLPAPPFGSPGMFRCAQPGLMEDLFTNVGFKNCNSTEVCGVLQAQTTTVYWNMMNEIGAPIVAALSKADEQMKVAIKKKVFELVNEKYSLGKVNIDCSALVIDAIK